MIVRERPLSRTNVDDAVRSELVNLVRADAMRPRPAASLDPVWPPKPFDAGRRASRTVAPRSVSSPASHDPAAPGRTRPPGSLGRSTAVRLLRCSRSRACARSGARLPVIVRTETAGLARQGHETRRHRVLARWTSSFDHRVVNPMRERARPPGSRCRPEVGTGAGSDPGHAPVRSSASAAPMSDRAR